MSNSFKLTLTFGFLIIATVLNYFVLKLESNSIFVSILAFKKFMLIGLIYLEGIESHWFYRIFLTIAALSLIFISLIWSRYNVC